MKNVLGDYNKWYDLMDDQWAYEGEEKPQLNNLLEYLSRTVGVKIDIFANTLDEMFCDENTLVPVGEWFTSKERCEEHFNVDPDTNTIISLKSTSKLKKGFREFMGIKISVKACVNVVDDEPVLEEVVIENEEELTYVKYLDNTIYVTQNVIGCYTKPISGCRYLNTKKNLEYYGYTLWKGQLYKPGLTGYHHNERVWRNKAHESAKYRIGFEIEKETIHKKSISSKYLKARTEWVAEEDSSLSGTYGVELISPIYNLLSRASIKADLEHMRRFIDGDQGLDQESCGGHINVSQRGINGFKLLAKLKGFAPLLYAMYPNRVDNGYSSAKKFTEYTEYPCKQAFYPKSDRLEIRIFPVVKSVEDLMLRYELVRYMMVQSTKSPATVVTRLLDPTTKLHTIIRDLGFEPKVLAQAMLEADAKYDHTKYSEAVHVQVGKLGLKIHTRVKPTQEQRRQLKRDYKKFLKSPFLKSIVNGPTDTTDVGYQNRDVMRIMEARFQEEFL